MLIKLSYSLYVAADDVAEVSVNDHSNLVTVRMKNGIGHPVDPDFGKGAYATLDRLVREINAACSTLVLSGAASENQFNQPPNSVKG
jgi:hypothetical protein